MFLVFAESAKTGKLKISRINKCSGSCKGGDEIWMLVEKINKSKYCNSTVIKILDNPKIITILLDFMESIEEDLPNEQFVLELRL